MKPRLKKPATGEEVPLTYAPFATCSQMHTAFGDCLFSYHPLRHAPLVCLSHCHSQFSLLSSILQIKEKFLKDQYSIFQVLQLWFSMRQVLAKLWKRKSVGAFQEPHYFLDKRWAHACWHILEHQRAVGKLGSCLVSMDQPAAAQNPLGVSVGSSAYTSGHCFLLFILMWVKESPVF